VVDGAGNLILKKSASPGCEGQPGVIMQGHLDTGIIRRLPGLLDHSIDGELMQMTSNSE